MEENKGVLQIVGEILGYTTIIVGLGMTILLISALLTE